MKISTASGLFAAASLVSGLAFAQPSPYSPEDRIHWIEGKTVTITYSNNSAPAGVTTALMSEVLADIEAKFDGLNLIGLDVAVGNRDIANGCAGQGRNTVHICWEQRSGTDITAVSNNAGMVDGSGFYRQAYILLPSNNPTPWTESLVYSTLMHHMLHMLGFGHPASGDSVQTNSSDLTALDISGLQTMYGTGSCAITYNPTTLRVTIPFVSYAGRAYGATLVHDGGSRFSLAPNTLVMFDDKNMPTTRCQSLTMDANGDLRIPQVRIGEGMYWANLRFENDGFRLINAGQ